MIKKFLFIFLILNFLSLSQSYAGPYDDYTTPGINEGRIGSGWDDYSTPDINEGAIGSGWDDYSTPDVNEGAW